MRRKMDGDLDSKHHSLVASWAEEWELAVHLLWTWIFCDIQPITPWPFFVHTLIPSTLILCQSSAKHHTCMTSALPTTTCHGRCYYSLHGHIWMIRGIDHVSTLSVVAQAESGFKTTCLTPKLVFFKWCCTVLVILTKIVYWIAVLSCLYLLSRQQFFVCFGVVRIKGEVERGMWETTHSQSPR